MNVCQYLALTPLTGHVLFDELKRRWNRVPKLELGASSRCNHGEERVDRATRLQETQGRTNKILRRSRKFFLLRGE